MQWRKWRSGGAVGSAEVSDPFGSEPAREGSASGDIGFDGVHIHSCGNGRLWVRPYGESLGKAPSNQGLLPLAFRSLANPRLPLAPSLLRAPAGVGLLCPSAAKPASMPVYPLRRT